MGSAEPEEIVKAPHSFVINRGKLGKNANELMMNFRKIMEPFTAAHLRVRDKISFLMYNELLIACFAVQSLTKFKFLIPA